MSALLHPDDCQCQKCKDGRERAMHILLVAWRGLLIQQKRGRMTDKERAVADLIAESRHEPDPEEGTEG